MQHIPFDWRSREYSLVLTNLKLFVSILCVFYCAVYLVFVAFTNQNLMEHPFELFLPCYAGITLFVVKYFNLGAFYESRLLPFFLSELVNLACLQMLSSYLSEHSSILVLFSFSFIKTYQLDLAKSTLVSQVLLVKFVYQWYLHKFFTKEIKSVTLLTPYCAVFTLLVFNWLAKLTKETLISAYSRKAEKLGNTKEQLRMLIQNFPDGILIFDSEVKVKSYNEKILNLLGGSITDVIETLEFSEGKKYTRMSNSNRLVHEIKGCFGIEAGSDISVGITMINDSEVEWKVQKMDINSESYLLVISRNIDYILESERNASENRLKDVLIRTVSHEIRNPSNAISCLAEMILETNPEEEVAEKVKVIKTSSNLLNFLVNDLLDYSRILAGAFSIVKKYCRTRELLENCYKLMETQVSKKGLSFNLRMDDSLPNSIFTDPLRLSQVILNLLSNALKFTLKGKIELIATANSKGKMEVLVSDSGIGIAPSRLSLIFGAFESNRSRYFNPEGVGLGLHISNILSQELGGETIKAFSTVGKGSAFSFQVQIYEAQPRIEELDQHPLPNEPEETSPIVIPSSIEMFCPGSYRSKKVLVAEDNEFNRSILVEILSNQGFFCSEAKWGKEAVEQVQKYDSENKAFNLVIMDCDMPGMNGWEASKTINSYYVQGRINKLPNIVGYTGYNSERDIMRCFESGMVSYILKPSTPQNILRVVNSYIN